MGDLGHELAMFNNCPSDESRGMSIVVTARTHASLTVIYVCRLSAQQTRRDIRMIFDAPCPPPLPRP